MSTAKLIMSLDGMVIREIPLDKERLTVGRKPHNAVQIENLAVSGEHAAVVTVMNDSFIEDLNSTNGTIVNGKPIKKHFLQNGDLIEIGKHKLKYINEQPAGADYERTLVLRRPGVGAAPTVTQPRSPSDTQSGRPAITTTGRSPLGTAPGVPPSIPSSPGELRGAAIQVLTGTAAGRTLELTKNLTTVGKPGQQVAVITKRPTGYYVTHVEGVSHPQVNGQSIGVQPYELKDHDMIAIAGFKMEFFYKQ